MVSFLVVVSSAAVVYYGEYQQETTQSQHYAADLNSALASYRSLAGSYNASLDDYGTTLSLLTAAVMNLNTSTPARS